MSSAIFPTLKGLAWNRVKAPIFATLVQRSVNGSEVRASYYSAPLWRWTLTYEYLDNGHNAGAVDLATLAGFFLQRSGGFDSFLFSDWADNTVTAQSIGTGDGSTTTFQLVRTLGGFTETVSNLNGAASVYVNGVLQTLGTDYTLSATGLVTFAAAPAVGLPVTWSGSYYWAVRFAEDSVDFNNFLYLLWELKKVELVSVR